MIIYVPEYQVDYEGGSWLGAYETRQRAEEELVRQGIYVNKNEGAFLSSWDDIYITVYDTTEGKRVDTINCMQFMKDELVKARAKWAKEKYGY